jgi:hypothetical protein
LCCIMPKVLRLVIAFLKMMMRCPGSIIEFHSHRATIGECIISPKVRAPVQDLDIDASVMSVHASLVMGLDYTFGSRFKTDIRRKFGSTVHPIGKSDHFLMAVSFGRAKFKLNPDTAGLALESCLGGTCDDLLVI